MTNYILVTDSATEPVTLAQIKTALRIDGTDYDDILTPLIKNARQIGEKITGRDFINKTWKLYLDDFPASDCEGIEIRKSKLQSITSVKYYIDSVLTTFDSSNYYNTNDSNYSSIYLVDGKSWPNTDDRKQAVEITFVSGYGVDATYVPQAIKQAIISLITMLFENSGDCALSSKEISQFKYLFSGYIIPQKMVQVW